MGRFRFTLEPVLRLREEAETSAKEALAREVSLQLASERARADAAVRLDDAREAAPPVRATNGSRLHAAEAYVERRELEHAIAALGAATHEERVEASRRVLVLAARERQAIARLKERRRRAHAARLARAEARLLEDIGISVHRRGDGPSAA